MSYYRIIFIHTCISLLKKTLPSDQQHHISSIASAASSELRSFSSQTKCFNFFPYYSNEWNNLKGDMRNAKSLNIFKKLIFSKK